MGARNLVAVGDDVVGEERGGAVRAHDRALVRLAHLSIDSPRGYLSQQRLHFFFEAFHSRLLSRWAVKMQRKPKKRSAQDLLFGVYTFVEHGPSHGPRV